MKKWSLLMVSVSMMSTASSFAAAASPASGNMSQVIATLQTQIQTVANSVSPQIQKSQQINQAALTAMHQNIQQQLAVLQKQIQQVQDNVSAQVVAIQKEMHQLEVMH